jgi:O-antigen/teichoic acid export membrane protein
MKLKTSLDYIKYIKNTAITHVGFQRYFANTFWVFFEQVLRMIAAFVVSIWVARYLGPQQFGVFSYVLAFAALFIVVAKLGLDGILVRDLIGSSNNLRNLYLGTAFWLKFGASLLILLFFALLMPGDLGSSQTKFYIFIILCGTIFQSFEVIDFYFQSKVLSRYVSICKLAQLLMSSLLKLYLIFIEAELVFFVIVTLVDQITLASSFFLAYRAQKIGNFYKYFDYRLARQMIKQSWPLVFSSFVIMIYMRIDQIMINEILGPRDVGIYSAAIRISEVWYFIPTILTSSLFPAIVSAKKVGDKIFYSRLQILFSFLTWSAISMAIAISFLANWLIQFLYGESFQGAGGVLIIHIWTGVFVALGVVSGSWFTVENLQRYALYRTVCGAAINIVLNLFLIKKFGIEGAAFATLAAQAMTCFFFDLFTKETRLIFKMKVKAFYLKGIFC